MSWDWPTYFHDYGHDSSKYNLVSPNMVILLLEKYVLYMYYICIIYIFFVISIILIFFFFNGFNLSPVRRSNFYFNIIHIYRLKESDKKTVFSVLKKSERDKKKLLETVLKQLRQLAQTTQQS